MTHWAPLDAPVTRGQVLADCGVRVATRAIAQHGKSPTCPRCLDAYLADERLALDEDE